MKRRQEQSAARAKGIAAFILLALPLLLSIGACMPGRYLRTEVAASADVKGSYTLLLYGCGYPDRIKNLAVLAREGGPYEFELFAPAFDYEVRKGLNLEESIAAAQAFIRCSSHFQDSRVSRILDPDGAVLGYEVRPLYEASRFGQSDVLFVRYKAASGRVDVNVYLDPAVESLISRDRFKMDP